MGFFSRLFTFRGRVYRLRKKYDKIRERADREDDYEKRITSLKILDNVEPTLIILEEQNVSRFERGRMFATIDSAIEQAKAILGDKIRLERASDQRLRQPVPVAR